MQSDQLEWFGPFEQAQIREPVEQAAQGDGTLNSCQGRAEATVDP